MYNLISLMSVTVQDVVKEMIIKIKSCTLKSQTFLGTLKLTLFFFSISDSCLPYFSKITDFYVHKQTD